MINDFLATVRGLLSDLAAVLPDPRPRQRLVEVGLGLLGGEHPKTVSSAIEFRGAAGGDWSADYRLFSKTAWDTEDLFRPVLHEALELNPDGPVFAALDDVMLRKTGRCIPGTAYCRDPLSPPFHPNLVLGQRFLEAAVMVWPPGENRPGRAIPVLFRHAPPLKAPPRATQAERKAVKEARKKHNVSIVASEELVRLRQNIDQVPGGEKRPLIMTADGSFANRTFLANPPPNTCLVVRMRKNASLRECLPREETRKNRKYGPHLPTPEEMLADESIPLQHLTLSLGGCARRLRYKVIENVCWPRATRERPVRLILIKPTGYRLRKGGELLYRQPAFLLATGTDLPIQTLIRAYIARWEIEVSFRDEKTILGVGKAQVWNERSVGRTPAFHVACYSCLLLASIRCFDDHRTDAFTPLAPWRNDVVQRPSTRDLVRLLRQTINRERQTETPAHAAAA